MLVCQDHSRPSVTLALHWRPNRRCWKTDWCNFVKGTLLYLPCSRDAAAPAPVKPKAGGKEGIR
eukprot:9501115-Pyramimonas_sp.AAC.1